MFKKHHNDKFNFAVCCLIFVLILLYLLGALNASWSVLLLVCSHSSIYVSIARYCHAVDYKWFIWLCNTSWNISNLKILHGCLYNSSTYSVNNRQCCNKLINRKRRKKASFILIRQYFWTFLYWPFIFAYAAFCRY